MSTALLGSVGAGVESAKSEVAVRREQRHSASLGQRQRAPIAVLGDRRLSTVRVHRDLGLKP